MKPQHSLKKSPAKAPAEAVVKDIRRQARRHFSAEDKIRIVLDGLRGEDSIAELCRKEGIAQSLYYTWSKEFMEAGKRRLAGDTARTATTGEVQDLRREARALKKCVADQHASIATMQVGSLAEKAITLSRRMRRRTTTLPDASSPTKLQLFLPRSIPRTAICMGPLHSSVTRPRLHRGWGKGRAIHKGGLPASHRSLAGRPDVQAPRTDR